MPLHPGKTVIVGPYRPLLRQNFKRPARRWPLWWSESSKTPIFVVFLLTRRKVGYMKLKNGLYCQKNTRKSCLFSPPNTVWPAERRKTAIFADFRRFWPKDTTITPKQARNRHCTSILHRQRYYRGNSWDLLNLPTPPISCLFLSFLVFSCLFLVFSSLFFSWKAEEKEKKRRRKGKEKAKKRKRNGKEMEKKRKRKAGEKPEKRPRKEKRRSSELPRG